MTDPRERIAARLDSADVDPERFIRVAEGGKASFDHEHHPHDGTAGNYGIHTTADDPLVWIDIDDYGEIEDKSGLSALARLPLTLEQTSPHGGHHRLFAVTTTDGRLIAEVLKDEFGKANLKPSWGEVRVANQYVVGAGSQLDGCEKDWCDECATEEGGRYTLEKDREIAQIDASLLVDVLSEDSAYAADEAPEQAEIEESNLGNVETRLEYALDRDDKLRRLFEGDYSGYQNNGETDRSAAESALAMKLGFWFEGDEQTVRRLMDQADTKKWGERDDESYRASVLDGLPKLTEFFRPEQRADGSEVIEDSAEPGGERQLPTPGGLALNNGGYGQYKQRGENQDATWDEATNFQLETNSFATDPDDPNQIRIDMTVHPRAGEAYDVAVPPTVFNEKRTFKEEVVIGLTTTFSGGEYILNTLKTFVGTQDAPQRIGTRQMGRHGDEWVTPDGVFTAEGWIDDPEHVHVSRDVGAERKWALSPDDGAAYDEAVVRAILETLPKTRTSERFLPVLGWFYATPFKPLIQEWTGQFNLLGVLGETGSGKTASLSALWEAFGMAGDPMTADDTKYVLLTTLASTNSIPMWFDEYKPSDMRDWAVDTFWNEVRKTTRGGVSSRGNADGSTDEYHLRAPVVVSGEERVHGSAEERRGIYTTFRKAPTDTGSPEAEAFAELVGGSTKTDADDDHAGEIDYYEGYDLTDHARAYHRYALGRSDEEVRGVWREAAEYVSGLLARHGINSLEDLVEQGLQTVVFGAWMHRQFADEMGVEERVVTDEEIDTAVHYVATNSIGGANRKSHLDVLFEVAARAARHGYLEEGTHYAFVREGEADEELRMNLATAFDKIARYGREHEVAEDLLNSKDDYRERLTDAIDDGSAYIANCSQNTPPIGRAVGVYVQQATDALAGFSKSMFTDGEELDTTGQDGSKEVSGTPVGRLAAGYATITVECVSRTTDTPDVFTETGTLRDGTGTVDYVVWGREDSPEIEEGERYRIHDARVGHDPDGAVQVELDAKVATLEPIEAGVGHLELADPGSNEQLDESDEAVQTTERMRDIVRDHGPASKASLLGNAQAAGIDKAGAEEALESLKRSGRVQVLGGEWEVV